MSLQDILGTMIAGGMGGRTDAGPGFLQGFGQQALGQGGGQPQQAGTDWQKVAGLGALAYLGYRALQDRKANQSAAPQSPQESGGSGGGGFLGGLFGGGRQAAAPQETGGGGMFGRGSFLGGLLGTDQETINQRIGDVFGARHQTSVGDSKALLLIRAMIAAAASDGEISADERQAILSHVEQANATPDERRIVEQELQNPPSLDAITREVGDPQTADQVYLASRMALRRDSPVAASYLDYLANRLGITAAHKQELDAAM